MIANLSPWLIPSHNRQHKGAPRDVLVGDLYHAYQLVGEGGVLRSVVYQKFERSRVGEQGIYVVWSFSKVETHVKRHPITEPHWQKPDGKLVFWRRLE